MAGALARRVAAWTLSLTLLSLLGWFLVALSVVGSGYTVATAVVLRRFLARRGPVPVSFEPVTLLKPLHGAEPRLYDNLASFLAQRHHGPVQMLCGVGRADDAAVAVVEALRRDYPAAHIDLVVDVARHGSNGKVANLVNMAPHIAHDTVVLSDSDMAVPVDYLARVTQALAEPGVGAVTCLYRGRGDGGFWSRLGAAGSSWQFLPGVVFGLVTGLARPCMGSTIALRHETLAAIGGFAAFADVLADDHAMGAAVEATGRRVAVPPMVLVHAANEPDAASLWRHELRWAVTVRDLQRAGYVGSVVGMPLPLALIGLALCPARRIAAPALLLALTARWLVVAVADRGVERAEPLWLLPLRDVLGFAVYIASFFTRSVDWRGSRLRLAAAGRIAAETELKTTP